MSKDLILVLTCIWVLLSIPSLCISQCGSQVPRSHVLNPPIINDIGRDAIEYDLNKTLSVHIYITASAFNTYDYSAADYEPNWDIVNDYFAPMGMTFEICSETLIPNYQFNFITDNPEPDDPYRTDADLMAEHYTDNVINVYYVQEILSSTGLNVDGYAYFPGGPDAIVMEKGHGDLTLEHELGHFFGLYHTFETDFGNELVNGDNCVTTGDFICDTPADINGNYDPDACQYDDLGTDLNGDNYTPYLSNIMSYFGDCRCKFSTGQYNRMAWTYLNERNYLW